MPPMAGNLDRKLSRPALDYILHHVFLPPKLPEEDDFDEDHEASLLHIVCEELHAFQTSVMHDSTGDIEQILTTISHVEDIHAKGGIGINEPKLEKALSDLSKTGRTIALRIHAQNAGLLISKLDDSISFEAFELSPLNEAVITTSGRLKRSFPGVVRYLRLEDFDQPELQAVIANTLTKMSVQKGPKPKVRKAGRKLEENRDTTDPRLVTELFMAFISAIYEREDTVPRLGKHTREEVLYRSALNPWRRSPGWLFLRVTLQLAFARSNLKLNSQCDPYKAFMVFLMGSIVNMSTQYQLPAEFRRAMNAKVVRRLQKLQVLDGATLTHVEAAVRKSHDLVQAAWAKAIDDDGKRSYVSCDLERLRFDRDVDHHLPQLDAYLEGMSAWENTKNANSLSYPPELPVFKRDQFPNLRFSNQELMAYEVSAFEAWVFTHLSECLSTHRKEVDNCENLSRLTRTYYNTASRIFDGNPESISNMLLTVLELWIACDKAALSTCKLLGDYNPGFPVELFQCFILPFKTQMERLFHVEKYLSQRRASASDEAPSVFHGIGSSKSFTVRYFDESADHQALLRAITDDSEQRKRSKCKEYREKKALYDDLLGEYNRAEHEFADVVIDAFDNIRERQHSGKCRKCALQKKAAAQKIEIHEDSLPEDDLMSKSVVFELEPPQWFGYWRDLTLFVLSDVFGSVMADWRQPTWSGKLSVDRALASRFRPRHGSPRVGLLSEVKSYMNTHRREVKISSTSSEKDILFRNASRYKYYDTETRLFIVDFQTTDDVCKACTYSMPLQSSSLQQFLIRPAGQPNGPSCNTVIASQSESPDHISVEEYKSLASIPLGYRLQWINVLVQLSAPTIDFNKVETALIILQATSQAGPHDQSPVREGHAVANDPHFASKVVSALRDACQRVEKNWESFRALSIFTSVAVRLLSLSSSNKVNSDCLALLESIRETAVGWLRSLKDRAHSIMDSTRRAETMSKATMVALVCANSFNVDDEFLEKVLSAKDAPILIECGIVIQEGANTALKNTDALVKLLHKRWQTLSYRACHILRGGIIRNSNGFLDIAIKESWSSYEAGTGWSTAAHGPEYCLVSKTAPRRSGATLSVFFDLLTSELLVDGLPLARLPQAYERHPSYSKLFGRSSVDAMPSAVAGMAFSSKRTYAGHKVHFGMSSSSTSTSCDLRIQAEQDGAEHVFIPPRLFQNEFPTAFVDDFVHWYDTGDKCVYFRPASAPWTASPRDWKLIKHNHSTWHLVREDHFLISIRSTTAQALSRKLNTLEKPAWMQMTYSSRTSSIAIEMPRIQLSFHIASGSASLLSSQYKGMAVDDDQMLGSLIGLQDKLILRGGTRRLLILLEGSISYEKYRGHVSVTVDKDTVKRATVYEVDSLLKRLVSDGSLQSQLLLCYYHAITSFCLPDLFLGTTGTEQALSILSSAAVRSQDQLSAANLELLGQIARLTPERRYYPANERVMQVVDWSNGLSFSAQHNGLYRAVKSILDQADTVKIFYPDMCAAPELGQRFKQLLERDNIRSSTFDVSGFGAESHSTALDVVYASRDQCHTSEKMRNAFAASASVYRDQTSLYFPDCEVISYFTSLTSVLGPDSEFGEQSFFYDGSLLKSHGSLFMNWCSLHNFLYQRPPRVDKYRFMMWLSTLAFGNTVSMAVVYVLAFMFVSPKMQRISPPERRAFSPRSGRDINEGQLRASVRGAMLPFRPSSKSASTTSASQRQQQSLFQSNRDSAINRVVSHLKAQWPCEAPSMPPDGEVRYSEYINMQSVMQSIQSEFKTWYSNRLLYQYLEELQNVLRRGTISPPTMAASTLAHTHWSVHKTGFQSMNDILGQQAPVIPHSRHDSVDFSSTLTSTSNTNPDVAALCSRLRSLAASKYEHSYVDDLQHSLSSLSVESSQYEVNLEGLKYYLDHCRKDMLDTYEILRTAVCPSLTEANPCRTLALAVEIKQWPRISPMFLLRQLSRHHWSSMTDPWKACIVRYALAITRFQQAERLLGLAGNREDLARELREVGHTNWDPYEQPESLLLEVESGLLIREVQEEVAKQMRDPPGGNNAVMQLNMGEGKSSVIVPIVAAALADTSRLVRVLIARPQATQMFQMLLSKLCGSLDRRVYRMPFSRSLKIGKTEATAIERMCRECMDVGGILLVQPEHVLSLKLMGLQCLITGAKDVAQPLLNTQSFFDKHSRDIVDESDENFSVKFELVYAMGTQRAIDHCPQRWTLIHQILKLVGIFATEVAEKYPSGIELQSRHPGCFPKTRILHVDAQELLLGRIARHVCERGLGFAAATQPPHVRQALFRYITEPELLSEEIAKVENTRSESFWSKNTKDTLLLLRGLFAGGVLAFTLCQKRWRVNYGLHPTRERPTRLAVPYRAKDSPNARSEFSHPDVVIILTSLSYYYGGLTEGDLRLAFSHLQRSDQADIEYQAWVHDAETLSPAFSQLSGVNLEDESQFSDQILPAMRFAKSTVDYFLTHIVFPKEMKEFPHKLSASGWDLAQTKSHPTTGFSGTNDSRQLLPINTKQLDLPKQSHTNALVIGYLLQDETHVVAMSLQAKGYSAASLLLSGVINLQPPARVILDVGAQVIELSNLEMAKEWLRRSEDHDQTQAVVFFNDGDELSVVDRRGYIEALQTSSFAGQLDRCLVFLDEAHTRGTDLRLPVDYRAAVTLGPNVTKDRLVQACMRMRKLGKGQSITFCVPEEIQHKIGHSVCNGISVSDIIRWAISETWSDTKKCIPLWAAQGVRFESQHALWKETAHGHESSMTKSQAEKFLEDDSMTVEQRYGPRPGPSTQSCWPSASKDIQERCQGFQEYVWNQAKLQEEQERELSPEIEQERQIQKPQAAQPAAHQLHPDLLKFLSTGKPEMGSKAFRPAFDSLASTSAATHLDVSQFPAELLITADFARTIKPLGSSYVSDAYHRSPQWILTSSDASSGTIQHIIIISPFEAQQLLPKILSSELATLHVYAPRPNRDFPALDGLTLFTVPARQSQLQPSGRALLNLFAGQLYIASFPDYQELCKMLGLVYESAGQGQLVAVDGFLSQPQGSCTFRESPVKFLQVFMTKVRRNCEGIDKTHMGVVLGGQLLHRGDFDQ